MLKAPEHENLSDLVGFLFMPELEPTCSNQELAKTGFRPIL